MPGLRAKLPLAHHAGVGGGGVWRGLPAQAFDGTRCDGEIGEYGRAAQLYQAFGGTALEIADSEDGLGRAIDVDV